MKKSRKCFAILAFIFIMTAVCNLFYSLIYSSSKVDDSVICQKRFPLYTVEGFYVDTNENYYIGTYENEWVQVFDKNGNYKYTININKKFGTQGTCTYFYVDEDNYAHIYKSNRSKLYEEVVDMNKNNIISTKELAKSELKNLSEYKFNVDKNTCKNNNANYILESNNTKYPLVHNKIKVVDSMNNTHTVKLHVEKWIPLKAEMCFILVGIGVIFAISAYGWENMYYRGPFSIRKYEQ